MAEPFARTIKRDYAKENPMPTAERHGRPPASAASTICSTACGSAGRPIVSCIENVGRVAAFLASDAGRSLNGSVVYADGGFHAVA